MFKWTCFLVGSILGIVALWMLNDIRAHTQEQLVKIGEIATVGVEVSKDVQRLRKIGGLTKGDPELGDYTISVLEFIDEHAKDGKISDNKEMKKAEKLSEWMVNARKEALMLVFKEKSKEDILYKLSTTAPLPKRHPWFIQVAGAAPVSLEEWIRSNHPESKDLPQPQK